MPSVAHLLPTKLENPARISDRTYVTAMAMRTRSAVQKIRREDKDSLDNDWEARQMILQPFREHGFLVVLHPGDIGYHDDEVFENSQELIAKFNEGVV